MESDRNLLFPNQPVSSLPDPTGDRRTVLPSRRDSGTPPPAAPPKSYSVDEMLTQLRSPEGKRRRRRSEQPILQARKRRKRWIVIGISIVSFVLAAWYGVRLFQKLRLEGETFRENLNRRLSEAVGCQVELTRIRDGGAGSLSATEGRCDTRDADLVEYGVFSGVNAALTSSSWVSDEWGITMLSFVDGTIRFNPARSLYSGDTTGYIPPAGGRERAPGGFRFGISPEPSKISLDALRFTGGLNLEWPDAASDRGLESIKGLRGHAKFPARGGIEGAFVKGTLSLRGMPEMSLEHLQWKLDGRKLTIPGARIEFNGTGRAEITGNAHLVTDGGLDLSVVLRDLPLDNILPTGWTDRLSGKLSVEDGKFTASFGKGAERLFSGTFRIAGCVLKGLGFVNKLSFALQRPDLTVQEFPVLSGRFTWSPSGGLVVSELSGELDGTLRLTGGFTARPDGKLSGNLQAAASETALRARSADVPHPFGAPDNGWAGTEFSLSGGIQAVSDDLVLPGVSGAPSAVPETPAPRRGPSAPPATPGKEELERQFNELLPR